MPETAILLQTSIGGIKGARRVQGRTEGRQRGQEGTAPFYFGLAGTLSYDSQVLAKVKFCSLNFYFQNKGLGKGHRVIGPGVN